MFRNFQKVTEEFHNKAAIFLGLPLENKIFSKKYNYLVLVKSLTSLTFESLLNELCLH